MSYYELKAEVRKTHLGETLERTEKAFYGSIKKLADTGTLIKYNGWIFSPIVYKRFLDDLSAGRAVDLPAPVVAGSESPNEIAVGRYLSRRPDGATPTFMP